MNMISIEEAATLMNVPTAWAKGMVETGQLTTISDDSGVKIDAREIQAKGWDDGTAQPAVTYSHVNELMVTMGLRILH